MRDMNQKHTQPGAPSTNGSKLLMEIWLDRTGDGPAHPLMEFAGPRGDHSRALLSKNAKLLTTVWASTHFEAMTLYYAIMGWGVFTTDQLWDFDPYPEEWVDEQRNAGIHPDGK